MKEKSKSVSPKELKKIDNLLLKLVQRSGWYYDDKTNCISQEYFYKYDQDILMENLAKNNIPSTYSKRLASTGDHYYHKVSVKVSDIKFK